MAECGHRHLPARTPVPNSSGLRARGYGPSFDRKAHFSIPVRPLARPAIELYLISPDTKTGVCALVEVPRNASVFTLQALLPEHMQMEPIGQLRLLFGGRELAGTAMLSDYGITDNSTIHVHRRLGGRREF